MKFLKTALLLASMTSSTFSSAAGKQLPNFKESQYKIQPHEIFKGESEKVDLKSFPGAETFRTKLQEGAKKGPNFAGHYIVVVIGCGTQCQENWIIDAKTGKILNKFSSMIGTKYQLDSSLMIVNPLDKDLKKGYESAPEAPFWGTIETTYETWDGKKFNVLYQDNWVNLIKKLH